jgi:hypothetical protein
VPVVEQVFIEEHRRRERHALYCREAGSSDTAS